MISAVEIERFLHQGFIGRGALEPAELAERRALARAEVEHFLDVITEEPIGIQIGIVARHAARTRASRSSASPTARCSS